MVRALAQRSLLVLMLMLGSGVALATADEPVELTGSSAQGPLDATTATQREPYEKPEISSSHHQCYQQSRFPQRRAKKKSTSSPSSQASSQDRQG